MTIQVYPSSVKPSYSLINDQSFKTLINEMDSGAEQRRKLFRFSKRLFTLVYRFKTVAERNTVHDFYRSMAGAYDEFWFVDLEVRKWKDEYIGRGNGSTTLFDLHGVTVVEATLAVYVAGVLKTKDVDYVFITSPNGGAGANQVSFFVAPANGTLITCDVEAYLRIKGRFKEDSFKEEISTKDLVTFSVDIQEVQW